MTEAKHITNDRSAFAVCAIRQGKSLLIESKSVSGNSISMKHLRPVQVATLNKALANIPIVHKISDSGVGAKLVDVIVLYNALPYIHVHFEKSGGKYLLPYEILKEKGLIKEKDLIKYKI